MAIIPKKVVERFSKTIRRFQRVLKTAKDRDVNEADTVSIVSDILTEVFGFNKYLEITSEFVIRNVYCDLAIKTNRKIQYLIEVKAIGLHLKEHHLRQIVEYGSRQGAQWIVLTNGISWEIYRIRFEKPINYDLVCSFNFLELNPGKTDTQEELFLLCKEGLSRSIREDFYERVQNVNRFTIGAIVLGDKVTSIIRRKLRKLSSGLKIENSEIETILKNEVLKREVIEGEAALKAKKRVKRISIKSSNKSRSSKPISELPSESDSKDRDRPQIL